MCSEKNKKEGKMDHKCQGERSYFRSNAQELTPLIQDWSREVEWEPETVWGRA